MTFGEFKSVQNFIHEYKDKLPQKQREGFFNYNLAHLFYQKKDYKNKDCDEKLKILQF